jgi:hypothetical protein
MPVTVQCPFCQAAVTAPDDALGRNVSCAHCGRVFFLKSPGAIDGEAAASEKPDTYPRDRGFGNYFVDLLTFRRMIAPVLIQLIFWAASGMFICSGVMTIAAGVATSGATTGASESADRPEKDRSAAPAASAFALAASVVLGLAQIFLGPLVARLWAELAIVVFRINETLTNIDNKTPPR